jgi:hypothetical protein
MDGESFQAGVLRAVHASAAEDHHGKETAMESPRRAIRGKKGTHLASFPACQGGLLATTTRAGRTTRPCSV